MLCFKKFDFRKGWSTSVHSGPPGPDRTKNITLVTRRHVEEFVCTEEQGYAGEYSH